METMSELLVAKGIQAAIAGLDLDHPHAREACRGLVSSLESSLWRIVNAEWDAEEAALESGDIPIEPSCFDRFIVEGFDKMVADAIKARQTPIDTLNPEEEAAFDALEAEAIDNAHPVVFSPIEVVKP
mgnify:FL=1